MSEPFVARRRVEFHETDLAGIVHFSNFFRYMEYAEQEFLRTLGLSVAWRSEGQPLGFPRVAAACDYLAPARFDDIIDMQVSIVRLGTKSVTYRFGFLRAGLLIARGTVSAVCCRVASTTGVMESVAIPAAIREKLEPFVEIRPPSLPGDAGGKGVGDSSGAGAAI